MSYKILSQQNQYLYGRVEELAHQIKACKEAECWEEADMLKIDYDEIQELINSNLDKIEEIWETAATTFRKANRIISDLAPTEIQKQVISDFVDNPNQTMEELGSKYELPQKTANIIITNYLTHKYNEEPVIHE